MIHALVVSLSSHFVLELKPMVIQIWQRLLEQHRLVLKENGVSIDPTSIMDPIIIGPSMVVNGCEWMILASQKIDDQTYTHFIMLPVQSVEWALTTHWNAPDHRNAPDRHAVTVTGHAMIDLSRCSSQWNTIKKTIHWLSYENSPQLLPGFFSWIPLIRKPCQTLSKPRIFISRCEGPNIGGMGVQ